MTLLYIIHIAYVLFQHKNRCFGDYILFSFLLHKCYYLNIVSKRKVEKNNIIRVLQNPTSSHPPESFAGRKGNQEKLLRRQMKMLKREPEIEL